MDSLAHPKRLSAPALIDFEGNSRIRSLCQGIGIPILGCRFLFTVGCFPRKAATILGKAILVLGFMSGSKHGVGVLVPVLTKISLDIMQHDQTSFPETRWSVLTAMAPESISFAMHRTPQYSLPFCLLAATACFCTQSYLPFQKTFLTWKNRNFLGCNVSGLFFYTEQMDTKGLGRKLLLTPPPTLATPENPQKQVVGTVTASHACSIRKHFRALSMPALQREAAWAEERLLGDLRQSVPQNGHLHIIDVS